jgi:hypothetical protein
MTLERQSVVDPRGVGGDGSAASDTCLDHKLDEALRQTFPASDPVSVSRDDGPVYASPPCFLREVDPAYLGYLSTAEIIALLNQLLEGERAGARGIAEIVRPGAGVSNPSVLAQIAGDEGRFCAMLTRHITRFGGTPSPRTGSFYEKLIALDKPGERIDLLNRGQAWVVSKLRHALPKITDDVLYRDLKDMLDVHQRNVQRCTDIPPPAA